MIEVIRRVFQREDYRAPTKADFINSKYQVAFVNWREVVNKYDRPLFPNKDLWVVERFSNNYGWVAVSAQILPYFYEAIYFLDRSKAFEYKALLEDPNSQYFDGMIDYTGQDPAQFDLEFFPKD